MNINFLIGAALFSNLKNVIPQLLTIMYRVRSVMIFAFLECILTLLKCSAEIAHSQLTTAILAIRLALFAKPATKHSISEFLIQSQKDAFRWMGTLMTVAIALVLNLVILLYARLAIQAKLNVLHANQAFFFQELAVCHA